MCILAMQRSGVMINNSLSNKAPFIKKVLLVILNISLLLDLILLSLLIKLYLHAPMCEIVLYICKMNYQLCQGSVDVELNLGSQYACWKIRQ